MILNAADAGDVLGDDTKRRAFLLRSDGPPKMHDTVRDDHVRCGRVRPFLLAQLAEQALADQAVAVFVGGRGSAARQHLQQVGPADDADDLGVMHDRDPLDLLCLHQFGDLGKRGQLPDADDLSAHNVFHPPGVRLDVFRSQSGNCGKPLAPARAPTLGPGLRPAQQVAFGNDPDELPVLVEDGTPLIRKLIMSLATFSTVVSGVVVATALTMTSLALIRLSFRDQAKLPAPTKTAMMWINVRTPLFCPR